MQKDIYVNDIVSIEKQEGRFKVLSIDGVTHNEKKANGDSVIECVLLKSSKKVEKIETKLSKVELLKHIPKEKEIQKNEVESLDLDDEELDEDVPLEEIEGDEDVNFEI